VKRDHPSGAEQDAEKGLFRVELGGNGAKAKAPSLILNSLWRQKYT
jgi:hypothetical protein